MIWNSETEKIMPKYDYFCEENGHRLLKSSDEKDKFIFLIEKTESH